MYAMYSMLNTFPAKAQPTQVALAGPCPHQQWDAFQRSNPMTLAELRMR
jgi:hypothetical protein